MPNGDLLIKEASFDRDMGSYTCVASNDVGEDRAEVFFYPTALESGEETEGATVSSTVTAASTNPQFSVVICCY